MEKYVCNNCGVQYNQSEKYPDKCIICSDERQYVPSSGQKWTTLEELSLVGYQNIISEVEPNVYRIKTFPQVGIGQNTYLIRTSEGNFLWDCITFLDSQTIETINEMGGLQGIVLSHPHYYSSIVEWAEALNCLIYIHESDKEWVVRDSSRYVFWSGETLQLSADINVVNLGGHFDGSSVLVWNEGSQQQGTLFVGDTIFIVPDIGWVSFLYSHPNRIPLSASTVKRMMKRLSEYEYESIYGAFDQAITSNGKDSVNKSAARYIYHLEEK